MYSSPHIIERVCNDPHPDLSADKQLDNYFGAVPPVHFYKSFIWVQRVVCSTAGTTPLTFCVAMALSCFPRYMGPPTQIAVESTIDAGALVDCRRLLLCISAIALGGNSGGRCQVTNEL